MHNGDIKIAFKDCCGSIMINPSWSMNIVTRGASDLNKHDKHFID